MADRMRLALALALCLLTGSSEARNGALWAAFHAGGSKSFVQAAVGGNGSGTFVSSWSATGNPFGPNQSAVGQLTYVTNSGSLCSGSGNTDVVNISDGTKTWIVAAPTFFDFAKDGATSACVISFFLQNLTPGATTLTVNVTANAASFVNIAFHVVQGAVALDNHIENLVLNTSSNPVSAGSMAINTSDYVYTGIEVTNLSATATIVLPPSWTLGNNSTIFFEFDGYMANSPGGSINGQWTVSNTGANYDYSVVAIAVR